jgi:hypothetical protein
MPTSSSSAALRCAEQARAGGYLPAGTAASAPVFLLVETPLPWPADISDHPLLQPVAPVATAHRARIQGLVPDAAVASTPPGTTRVIVYRHPPGPFRRYVRHERMVPTDRLVEEVDSLLAELASAPASDLATPVRSVTGMPRPGAAYRSQNGVEPATTNGSRSEVDVLVCTHGSRDVCCGSDGIRMHRDLVSLGLPGVRVWRTSHTGGHRFAPTAVTFPDGRAWASASAGLLEGIVTRTLGSSIAGAHDRGCAAFPDPFTQAADGAALAAEGWGWLDLARTADSVALADDRRVVTVTGTDEVGGIVAYEAEVVVRRVVPVPDCGRPLDQARKTSPELEVVALTRN